MFVMGWFERDNDPLIDPQKANQDNNPIATSNESKRRKETGR